MKNPIEERIKNSLKVLKLIEKEQPESMIIEALQKANADLKAENEKLMDMLEAANKSLNEFYEALLRGDHERMRNACTNATKRLEGMKQ